MLPVQTNGAVMGGGLLGLEAAKALLDLGIPHTHIVEFASRLMPRSSDRCRRQSAAGIPA